MADQGAACMIGPSTTPESIAIANGLTIQKKITIWPTGTSMRMRTHRRRGHDLPHRSARQPAGLRARRRCGGQARRDASGKLVSVAYRNEPYGDLLSKGFAAAWTAKGGKVQGPVVFDPNQATFDSEAGQTVANNPDAYVVIDYPDTYAKFGAALVRTGKFDASKLVVAGRARLLHRARPTFLPQAIERAPGDPRRHAGRHRRGQALRRPLAEGGRRRAFLARCEQLRFHHHLLPRGRCGAIERSRRDPSTHPRRRDAGAKQYSLTNLADALKAVSAGEKIDYVGVAGAFEFGDKGDPTVSLFDIIEYHDGKVHACEAGRRQRMTASEVARGGGTAVPPSSLRVNCLPRRQSGSPSRLVADRRRAGPWQGDRRDRSGNAKRARLGWLLRARRGRALRLSSASSVWSISPMAIC